MSLIDTCPVCHLPERYTEGDEPGRCMSFSEERGCPRKEWVRHLDALSEKDLRIEQLERELAEAKANYQFMVDRAVNEKLDGYRELAATCATLANENDRLRHANPPDNLVETEGVRSVTALERLAIEVLDASREDFTDVDGGWLQDKAHDLGVLVAVHVTEPCGEHCACAEYHGDFPAECYRYSEETQSKREFMNNRSPE